MLLREGFAFVHVSAIGSNPDSASDYGRTKGLGEQGVRAGFPDATIIRPSVVFGAEDDFTNRFASMARFAPTASGESTAAPMSAVTFWSSDLIVATACPSNT